MHLELKKKSIEFFTSNNLYSLDPYLKLNKSKNVSSCEILDEYWSYYIDMVENLYECFDECNDRIYKEECEILTIYSAYYYMPFIFDPIGRLINYKHEDIQKLNVEKVSCLETNFLLKKNILKINLSESFIEDLFKWWYQHDHWENFDITSKGNYFFNELKNKYNTQTWKWTT